MGITLCQQHFISCKGNEKCVIGWPLFYVFLVSEQDHPRMEISAKFAIFNVLSNNSVYTLQITIGQARSHLPECVIVGNR